MINALNLKPSDIIAVAVQDGDGSCLILSSDSSGARPDFTAALIAAAEDAALTHKGVLIPHQSIPALRRLLMGHQADGDVPSFLR
jgi:hypothetical protein